MTDLREPPAPSPSPTPAPAALPGALPAAEPRRHVRREVRRRESTAHRRRRRVLLGGGAVMVTVGLVLLGIVLWQFLGTNWLSKGRQAEAVAAVEEGWGQGTATSSTDWGTVEALLRIPRFGEDFVVPVLAGSSDEVLAAGVGHLEDTAGAGEVGNYVLAGHRVTNGEPFADFPALREGDLVEVETRDAVHLYELTNGGTELVVDFTADWVLDPRPVNPDPAGVTAPLTDPRDLPAGTAPEDRLITLLTCSEIFHTDNRSVTFGRLVETVPKVPTT